ncbi:ATP-binding protein [Candidatus Phytoplasma pini]|uniref:ATP-binding protein n=1 Tax=Candidatus Phytoplasma pini TaxID=267362 RepID=UPI001FE5514A|nr:SbcC/MukB-like Walker B domain-containing protein [Candidatus Phytoplasma pini]
MINWHLFSNQTIDIKGNTLISGENGSGKSTLLDALQYVLIAGKSGVKFNIAANENAKRSLEGYIKGKIGAENKEFLRKDDVITHISLEFYDPKENKYTILGCVLELSKIGLLKEKFYLFSGFSLEEDIFIFDNKPKNHQEMRNYLQKLDYYFDFFDTKKKYQIALGKYLQIDIMKYIKMLPKALVFKPLDLKNFVFEFLLEENPINIESLKNNVQQLKKIEFQIETEKNKIKQLTVIIEANKKLKSFKNQLYIYYAIEKMVFLEQHQINFKKFLTQKENFEKEITNLQKQKIRKKLDLEEIDNQILQLKSHQIKDDVGLFLYNLQQNINKNKIFIQDLEKQKESFQKQLNLEMIFLQNLFNKINKNILQKSIDRIQFFLKTSTEENYNLLCESFTNSINYLKQKNINLNIENSDLLKEILILGNSLSKINVDLESLNRSLSVEYHPNIIKLISLLKEKLKSIYQKEIEIYTLCELIEIKDELWRNAIEGFLGIRKFNLIVDSAYFDSSLRIYENVQKIFQIYDVGLVNLDSIPDIDIKQTSLAFQIFSDHYGALKYVKILLSHVTCELNIDYLKKHKTAITPQGMIYGNYTAKQLNPKSYYIPYIGIRSKNIRKQMLIEKSKELQIKLKQKQDNLKKNESLIELIQKIKMSLFFEQNHFACYQSLQQKKIDIEKMEKQKEQIQLNQNLTKLEINLQQLKKNKERENQKLENILEQIAQNENHILVYQEKIQNLEKQIILMKEKIDTLHSNIPEHLLTETNVQFFNYTKKYSDNYFLILKSIQNGIQNIEQQKNEQKIQIITLMNTYINDYHLLNLEPKLENFEYFVKEYDLITSKNLIQYEKESKELSSKTEIIFKEEFISKLKESFENAQQQIENLNILLKNRPFGNDHYQIILKASNKPYYNKYYSSIMEEKDFSLSNDLPIENLNFTNKSILLDELFRKIISYEQEYISLAYTLLDYRNYLNYDIQINDKDGNISLFSKVFREKSGGETQVPFYIIIAICFEQLLFENSEYKGCLVLFDEAFNNMDENRIDSMMSFLGDLKIQFFIAIPPQRIVNILPYVTTNLLVMKEQKHAFIENFTKE